MLHQFPAETAYHEAEELVALMDSEPENESEAVERLSRLLPLLDDVIIPVWRSPPLPSETVGLVSFADKQGTELIATICESGLLAVITAIGFDEPRSIGQD
jgi:hypothetical protein